MIYFFYGDDSYRLKKTIDAFSEKFGDVASNMNTSVFEGDFDIEKIRSDVLSLPFLAENRLVIIKNILAAKGIDGKKVADILDKKPDSTIMLFIEEGQPDKRSVLYKRLMKEKSKEMGTLQGGELTRWIKDETEKAGGEIDTKEASILAGYFGGDLWHLKNEIEKLVAYNKKITGENIEKLSVPNLNVRIFDLTDAITVKNKERAFDILEDLIESGENEMYILSMIQWQVRNLALVYGLKNLGEYEIAKKAKLNPFIVKKSLAAARKIGSDQTVKKYYGQIIEAENDIKTGAKDLDVALELLINRLTD